MNWTDFYIQYKKSGIVGNCPQCQRKMTAETYSHAVSFICHNCKISKHFDEIKTDVKELPTP